MSYDSDNYHILRNETLTTTQHPHVKLQQRVKLYCCATQQTENVDPSFTVITIRATTVVDKNLGRHQREIGP